MVLRIQGVLCLKDLPPITNRPRCVFLTRKNKWIILDINNTWYNILSDAHKSIHLRQGVTLTGFGSASFNRAIDSIFLIHTLFGRALRDGMLEKWQPPRFGSHVAFDSSNRYFSSRRLNSSAVPVSFPELVDPKGILAALAGDDLIHCEENQVYYYEITDHDDNGNMK